MALGEKKTGSLTSSTGTQEMLCSIANCAKFRPAQEINLSFCGCGTLDILEKVSVAVRDTSHYET